MKMYEKIKEALKIGGWISLILFVIIPAILAYLWVMVKYMEWLTMQ